MADVSSACTLDVRPASAPRRPALGLTLALLLVLGACGDDEVRTGPVPDASGPVVAVAAGYYHLCALGSDGETYCWGQNVRGELGGGTTDEGSWYIAVRVVGGHTFISLTSAEFYTCGIATDGTAYCWGTNSQSVLGRGETPGDATRPMPVAGGHSFRQLAAGEDFACGVALTGAAYCWGWNVWGQLGSGDTVEVHTTPTAVVGGIEFGSLTAGYAHACGVSVEGKAHCWGRDLSGVLGHGSDAGITRTPLPVVGDLEFTMLSAGLFHTCGLTVQGDAYCWGSNGDGELGDASVGETVSRQPVRVAGGHRWTQLDAGPYHTCAVTSENAAYCWGAEWGIFKSTSGRFTAEPFPVPGDHEFASVSAGFMATCGVRTDGELLCWGPQYGDEPFRLSIETAEVEPMP